jgi:hypothetical protein
MILHLIRLAFPWTSGPDGKPRYGLVALALPLLGVRALVGPSSFAALVRQARQDHSRAKVENDLYPLW